jgi:uncharacterized protein (DUF1501 family)/uncharacterized protein (DUF1800 family)
LSKKSVWTSLTLQAKDQLRQRVAWALSQIFVISSVGDLDVKNGQTEVWTAYYDIFVRHGLGFYGDILKEVAFSPMMGRYLTFQNSKSYAESGFPPDENFAREIMQLFTIGLWKLELDGSFSTDENGERIPTYSNKNIQSFARVWTGFRVQKFRGNIEGHRGTGSMNFLDPMRINQKWHDVLPKIGLEDEYLGDRVQLCSDVPAFSFFRKGSQYINIGERPPSEGSPIPGDLDPAKTPYKYGPNVHPQYSPPRPDGFDSPFTSKYKRLVPTPESSLFQALCGKADGSVCTFPAEVTLDRDIDCHGRECQLDKEIVYVKIVDPVTNVSSFYQYVQPLCVQMAFYNNPKMLGLNHNAEKKMCADPKVAIAGTVCCMTPNQPGGYFGFDRCEYHLEKVTWSKAVAKCASLIGDTVDSFPPGPYDLGRFWPWLGGQENPTRAMAICHNSGDEDRGGMRALDGCGYNYRASWIDEPCGLQVQIDKFGRISVVHSDTTEDEVKLDSGNVFHVHWRENAFPSVENDQCGGDNSGCNVHHETCLCNLSVTESPVFREKDDPPTAAEVRHKLKIGSPAVSAFALGDYRRCTTDACNSVEGVEIYAKAGSTAWSVDAIWKIQNPTFFLYNRISSVRVGSTGAFSFRNVPHFISLKESSKTGMDAEIQALLDSLYTHDNMAPFIAHRLIQHLVTSNPSPRYVRAVAVAFREGDYEGIGSGKYGDLAAAVAAVLLDPEARTPVLDADPSFGKVREPHLKLMHVLRSLEFQSGAGGKKEVHLPGQGKIGMQPFHSPSVFNFYAPDFQPPGILAQKGLFAPEMMLGTAPFLLGFLNGVSSLIQHGLTSISKGFGPATGRHSSGASLRDGDGSREQNGFLTFLPLAQTEAEAVINELDVVLTHGRLDASSRSIITKAYQDRLTNPSPVETLNNGDILEKDTIFKLHETNYNCRESHNGGTFLLTLQKTAVVKGGIRQTVWLRNARNKTQELKVRSGLRHLAWGGTGLYLNQDHYIPGAMDPNDPSPPLSCALINSMFLPGDTLSISKESISQAPLSALKLAQALMISSAEFHTSNVNWRRTRQRQKPFSVASKNRPYKAIVVVFMGGGADSWNFLVPNSGCKYEGAAFDLFGEYTTLRKTAALSRSDMLPISSPNDGARNKQPCDEFGVNPGLSNVNRLYKSGDAAFVANLGPLVEPIPTRTEYTKRMKKRPDSLYSHNVQQRTAKTVHAGSKKKPKGMLGRITEALTEQADPYAAAQYSMDGVQVIFDGKYTPSIVGNEVERLTNEFGQKQYLEEMLQDESTHGFSEAYSDLLNRSVVDSDRLGKILDSAAKKPTKFGGSLSKVERQMKQVAAVILARDATANEREVFYVDEHGFDSHFVAMKPGTTVYERVQNVDNAVRRLEEEMKAEGIWDDIVVVSASDFGRKIVPNGGGTDHAWGGNYFVAGGSIKGGQILGEYPSRLDETSDLNIFNSGGRFIPSTSWEAVWSPIADWFGVDPEWMDEVLPNRANFPVGHMFHKTDLFE